MTTEKILLSGLVAPLIAIGMTMTAPKSVAADDYPSSTITIVSPFSAGGGVDTTVRVLANHLPEALGGTTVLVQNRAGAGGSMGAQWFTANASPDGYTLLAAGASNHYSVPWAQNVDYHPIDDFIWIARVSVLPAAVVVRKDLPVDDLEGLVAYLRENEVTYAHTGFGGREWLQALAIEDAIGAAGMVGIPFDGGGQAAAAVAAGDADITFVGLPGAEPLEAQGLLKILGMIGPAPATRPDMATFEEAGFDILPVMSHVGIAAPVGTPDAIVEKLAEAIKTTLESDSFRSAAETAGIQVAYLAGDEYRSTMAALYETSGKFMNR
ncbi:MAG: tripartite tricarboxylate transporter substrate binding protein [Salinarimonadaceae bacterium]|nr:MAG: tripartite tricarboxylate transporter substrate binding protein [Salinarimonadaceae bacterium]